MSPNWLKRAAASDILPLHLTWICTLGLAIFAAVAYLEARRGTEAVYSQVNTLKDQLKLMKDDRRPWIYVSNVEPNEILQSSDALQVSVFVTARNTGKSPAGSVHVQGNFFPGKLPVPKASAEYEDCQNARADLTHKQTGTVLLPEKMLKMPAYFWIMKAKLAEEMARQINPSVVACLVYYEESEKLQHQTKFGFSIEIKNADMTDTSRKWTSADFKLESEPFLANSAD